MGCPNKGLKATSAPCYPGLGYRSFLVLWLGRDSHFERQALVVKHLLRALNCLLYARVRAGVPGLPAADPYRSVAC